MKWMRQKYYLCEKHCGHKWELIGITTCFGEMLDKFQFRCGRCGMKYEVDRKDLADCEKRTAYESLRLWMDSPEKVGAKLC